MNTLLAESGSTKTDWYALEGPDRGRYFETEGLNPAYRPAVALYEALAAQAPPWAREGTDRVIFYGAGCQGGGPEARMHEALRMTFGDGVAIEVGHDMLAAARALAGKSPGLIAILGTGSNACLWDGGQIVGQAINLGWALGDEGSGGYLGRRLVTDYFYGRMPAPVGRALAALMSDQEEAAEGASPSPQALRDALIARVYGEPMPNRWLASLAPLALGDGGLDGRGKVSTIAQPTDGVSAAYLSALLDASMDAFIQTHLLPLAARASALGLKARGGGGLPVHATGGVALALGARWARALARHGLVAGRRLARPIHALLPEDLQP